MARAERARGRREREGGESARRRLMSAVSSENKVDLGALPVVAVATYDSFAERKFATCLAGTRTQLLDQIADWASDATVKVSSGCVARLAQASARFPVQWRTASTKNTSALEPHFLQTRQGRSRECKTILPNDS